MGGEMLVLTRRVEEGVVAFDPGCGVVLSFKVLGIKNGQVKIGVDAPKGMGVFRQEIVDRSEDLKDVISKLLHAPPKPREEKTGCSITAAISSFIKRLRHP